VTRIIDLLAGDSQADRIVPHTGPSASLALFTAAAMTFLAVFALALSLASGRLANRWSDALARTATIRISATDDQIEAQTLRVLEILKATPGITSARAMTDDEQKALLAPWFGPDLPLDQLPIPRLIELTEADPGYDSEGLRQRLAAEAPGASLDDHTRWRRPLAVAAQRLRLLGGLSMVLILGAMAAMITLAANAALEANSQIIKVMRLVGARDAYIARAFVRRFTLRVLIGAAIGAVAAMICVYLLPSADAAGGFLTGLGFQGAGWILPLLLPLIATIIAFSATRLAAFRKLRTLT
jgi:cell division transport system permease protein